MRLPVFRSIRSRLIAYLFIIEAGMAATLTWNNYHNTYLIETEHLQQTAQSLIGSFSRSAVPLIAQIDYASLEESIYSTLDHPELLHISILSSTGQPLIALSNRVTLAQHNDMFAQTLSAAEIDAVTQQTTQDVNKYRLGVFTDQTFEIANPISLGGINYGTVHMTFSLSEMSTHLQASFAQSLLAALIGIALTLVVTIVVTFKITENLHGLAKAASSIGKGNFDVDFPPDHFDDVGVVTNAFKKMVHDIRQSTDKLQASEKSLETTLQSIGDGMIATDATGRITRMNRTAEILTGFAIEEALDRPIEQVFQIINTQTRKKVANPAREVLRTGKIIGLANHTSLIRKDGEERHIADSGAPITDEAGNISGVILVFSDVTEKYQQVAQLRESEAQYRNIFSSSGDGIIILGLDGTILGINPKGFALLECSAEELLHKKLFDIQSPTLSSESHFWSTTKKIERQQISRTEGTIIKKSGETMHYEARGTKFVYESQPAYLVLFSDITTRKQSETELKLLSTVFANTHDGIIITDAETRIIAVNASFSKITGYHRDEVLNQKTRLFRSGIQDQSFYKKMWTQLNTSRVWQGEMWNKHKDGRIYPVWQTINPIYSDNQVTNYISVFSDISDLKKAEKELEYLAHYDALTGLPNRVLLRSRLAHALEQAHRHGHKVALLFLDLDRFKNVNDSLGHPVGDQLLKAIADRLSKRIREGDTLCRLGGDEFIVVLDYIQKPSDAAHAAQDLIETLATPFSIAETHEIFIGASVGIAIYPDDSRTSIELEKNADAAMYKAKESGRNTFHFYTYELSVSADQRLTLENSLRKAIENEEIKVVFQPQVDVNGQLVGVEALARWKDADQQEIPPITFIPIAEDTGLIIPLGQYVLETACRLMEPLFNKSDSSLKLAVNLSAKQFMQTNLTEHIEQTLARTSFNPEQLEIEITESALMETGRDAIVIINSLRRLGVSIAIDDFGTGYSSLSYLKHYAIDKLKIDRSFVKDLPQNIGDREITSTIISMGRNMELSVLAEGVETKAQFELLKAQGCHYFQGYYFGKPQPPHTLNRLLTV